MHTLYNVQRQLDRADKSYRKTQVLSLFQRKLMGVNKSIFYVKITISIDDRRIIALQGQLSRPIHSATALCSKPTTNGLKRKLQVDVGHHDKGVECQDGTVGTCSTRGSKQTERPRLWSLLRQVSFLCVTLQLHPPGVDDKASSNEDDNDAVISTGRKRGRRTQADYGEKWLAVNRLSFCTNSCDLCYLHSSRH